jgi:hypothetical protein
MEPRNPIIMKSSTAAFTPAHLLRTDDKLYAGRLDPDRSLNVSSTLLRAACATFALLSGSAFAAEPLNVRPGQWEFTQTMTASGAPIYIEEFTAAQRAEYAKSWAKDAGKPSTSTDDQCISEKDIKEATLFKDKTQEGKECKEISGKSTRTAWNAVIECKDAKTTTRTSVDYTAPSPDRLTGVLKSSTTSPNGTTVFDFKFSGRWVGAKCSEEDDAEEESEDSAEQN